ncbi:MAG: hypothetical protein AB7O28_27715 [Vicinamibacterales bacterium]
MRQTRQSRPWRIAAVLGGVAFAGYLIFGSFGQSQSTVNLGTAKITAQPTGQIQAQVGVAQPNSGGGETFHAAGTPKAMSAAKQAARQAHEEARERAFMARAAALPASDPRVPATPAPRLSALNPKVAGNLIGASAVPPGANGSMNVFRVTEIDPPAGFASSVGEPAAAQNGKHVFETWNWFAARSSNGGASFTLIDPETYGPAMPDFCCDQDVIYDKGGDTFIWERMGIGDVGSATNHFNRVLLNISPDAFITNSCSYTVTPGFFGLTNAFLDYPRVSLSDKWFYISFNVFSFNGTSIGGYLTHALVRLDLDSMGNCAGATFNTWTFPDGWSPAMVENAKEIMYIGDQIVTSTGLNNTFRVSWIFDDSTTLNFVDRTIASYQFTSGNAVCPVPGGANPCARADQRVVGAAVVHNTPSPNALGGAGDKVDFFWNVAQGNGFPVPYTESATFQGQTIQYTTRKLLAYNPDTLFYTAVGANDRQHSMITAFWFNPGQAVRMIFGIDDDFNGNANAGWEVWQTGGATSTANWTANNSGDYLRARQHSPVGTGWIFTGLNRNAAAAEYRPVYSVWGRGRDLDGFNRFDQQ